MQEKRFRNRDPTPEKGFSEEYRKIKSEIENVWPAWKVETYNVNFATSKHARKIEKGR